MRKPIALRTIDHVPEGYRLIRPAMPVTVPSTTEYYICGRCSTLLAVAEQCQLHHLVIECRECCAQRACLSVIDAGDFSQQFGGAVFVQMKTSSPSIAGATPHEF
jgi:hypothetical protein